MQHVSRYSDLIRKTLLFDLLIMFVAGVLQSCTMAGHPAAQDEDNVMVPTTGTRGELCCAMAKGVPKQGALVQTAVGLLGRNRVEVGGRHYTPDCSGLVRGLYATQRVDLYDGLGELDGGNGVGRIYTHVVEHGRIHYGPTVHPGGPGVFPQYLGFQS